MKEHPILFNTEMVQAILAGRKTQTRRIVKLADGSLPTNEDISYQAIIDESGEMVNSKQVDYIMDFTKTFPHFRKVKPKYQVGDTLWVRETWMYSDEMDKPYWYKADFNTENYTQDFLNHFKEPWLPSIHMPKEACRLFLRVTDVRVERLCDILEDDAIAEGVEQDFEWHKEAFAPPVMMWHSYTKGIDMCEDARTSFFSLWKSVYGKESLDASPWVWVYEFEVIPSPDKQKI